MQPPRSYPIVHLTLRCHLCFQTITNLVCKRANFLTDYDVIQEEFIGKEIKRIREMVGPKGRVIGAVSGGVDSTVAAKLMHEAIGDRYVFS